MSLHNLSLAIMLLFVITISSHHHFFVESQLPEVLRYYSYDFFEHLPDRWTVDKEDYIRADFGGFDGPPICLDMSRGNVFDAIDEVCNVEITLDSGKRARNPTDKDFAWCAAAVPPPPARVVIPGVASSVSLSEDDYIALDCRGGAFSCVVDASGYQSAKQLINLVPELNNAMIEKMKTLNISNRALPPSGILCSQSLQCRPCVLSSVTSSQQLCKTRNLAMCGKDSVDGVEACAEKAVIGRRIAQDICSSSSSSSSATNNNNNNNNNTSNETTLLFPSHLLYAPRSMLSRDQEMILSQKLRTPIIEAQLGSATAFTTASYNGSTNITSVLSAGTCEDDIVVETPVSPYSSNYSSSATASLCASPISWQETIGLFAAQCEVTSSSSRSCPVLFTTPTLSQSNNNDAFVVAELCNDNSVFTSNDSRNFCGVSPYYTISESQRRRVYETDDTGHNNTATNYNDTNTTSAATTTTVIETITTRLVAPSSVPFFTTTRTTNSKAPNEDTSSTNQKLFVGSSGFSVSNQSNAMFAIPNLRSASPCSTALKVHCGGASSSFSSTSSLSLTSPLVNASAPTTHYINVVREGGNQNHHQHQSSSTAPPEYPICIIGAPRSSKRETPYVLYPRDQLEDMLCSPSSPPPSSVTANTQQDDKEIYTPIFMLDDSVVASGRHQSSSSSSIPVAISSRVFVDRGNHDNLFRESFHTTTPHRTEPGPRTQNISTSETILNSSAVQIDVLQETFLRRQSWRTHIRLIQSALPPSNHTPSSSSDQKMNNKRSSIQTKPFECVGRLSKLVQCVPRRRLSDTCEIKLSYDFTILINDVPLCYEDTDGNRVSYWDNAFGLWSTRTLSEAESARREFVALGYNAHPQIFADTFGYDSSSTGILSMPQRFCTAAYNYTRLTWNSGRRCGKAIILIQRAVGGIIGGIPEYDMRIRPTSLHTSPSPQPSSSSSSSSSSIFIT